jgi:chromosome segregation ATPase
VYRDAGGTEILVALDEQVEVIVGRDPKAAVTTRNPSVSRAHARIAFADGGWQVTDLGSSNHCYINDEEVEEGSIAAGDALRFGNFEVQVEARSPTEAVSVSDASLDSSPETQQDLRPAHSDEPLPLPSSAMREQVTMLETAVADAGARVEELELRCQELELRESRHEQELDGWHARHERSREQLDHTQGLLESTRRESSERETLLDELERTVSELQTQEASRESGQQEIDEERNELKAKVVQRDRRVDELERELDLMEYDLRSVREELEGLEDSLRQDSAEVRGLERELALLREVNSDKENVVTELKLKIEAQAREIYDLKAGTAVQDLEVAKQEVLEQYFDKNREVDRLAEALKEAEHRERALDGQIEQMAKQITERRDISEDPGFQRKVRELERAQTDREEAVSALERSEQKLAQFGPDVKAKMEGEIAFLERKNKALTERVQEMEASSVPAPEPLPTVAESTFEARDESLRRVEEIKEAYVGWKSNIHLLKTYLDELTSPGGSETQVTVSLSSMRDLIVVLREDAGTLGSELVALKDLLARE